MNGRGMKAPQENRQYCLTQGGPVTLVKRILIVLFIGISIIACEDEPSRAGGGPIDNSGNNFNPNPNPNDTDAGSNVNVDVDTDTDTGQSVSANNLSVSLAGAYVLLSGEGAASWNIAYFWTESEEKTDSGEYYLLRQSEGTLGDGNMMFIVPELPYKFLNFYRSDNDVWMRLYPEGHPGLNDGIQLSEDLDGNYCLMLP